MGPGRPPEVIQTQIQRAAPSQADTPYADALRGYGDGGWLRVHVPGHAGDPSHNPGLTEMFGPQLLRYDVPPLIEGVDIGAEPTPLDLSQQLAAQAWGAARTWFLTNGASQGNHIAMLVARMLAPAIVVQRSVHSSAVDGLVLAGLRAGFVQPSIDTRLGIAHGVGPARLRAALAATPEAGAALVISPSYFGAIADIGGLAAAAHEAGVPLIVDEAWGAHLGLHPALPASALSQGADLVVSSTHKLAGSLTQAAMLHLADGRHRQQLEPLIERAARTVQATSVSGILKASLDLARRSLVTSPGRIAASVQAADSMREAIRSAGRYRIASDGFGRFPDVVAIDPLRVVIDTRAGRITGHEARARLIADHRIYPEVATDSALVLVVGAGTTPDTGRILAALHQLPAAGRSQPAGPPILLPEPGPMRMTMRQAFFARTELVPAGRAAGRISADTLAAYPPGIPNVLPGELITRQVVEFFHQVVRAPGGYVRGAPDLEVTRLRVVCPAEETVHAKEA